MIITKPQQLVIMKAAIDAAVDSSHDAGTQEYTTQQKFQLNEQWCQSYVGFAINDCLRSYFSNDGGFVTFETSVGWLQDFCGRQPGRPPAVFSSGGRYDIIAWDDKGRVSGVLEIKDTPNLSKAAIDKDCSKIVAAIDKLASVKWGIFLFSVRSSPSKNGEGSVNQLLSKSRKVVDYVFKGWPDHAASHMVGDSEAFGDCRVLWTGILLQEAR